MAKHRKKRHHKVKKGGARKLIHRAILSLKKAEHRLKPKKHAKGGSSWGSPALEAGVAYD